MRSRVRPTRERQNEDAQGLAHHGGSRGLGRALCEAVLAGGDRVVATAHRPERLAALVDLHGAIGPDAESPEAAHGAVAAAVSAFGRLDVVVNNAGYTNVGSIEDTPLEELEAQIATDLWGPIRVAHAALPVMRAQGAGHIVQTSMVGRRTYPALGAYRTTARALEGFSEALAAEVAPTGIRVTIVTRDALQTDRPAPTVAAGGIGPYHRAPVGGAVALIGENVPIGDPVRTARAILGVVAEERPPLRLPVGADAWTAAEVGACSARCDQYAR